MTACIKEYDYVGPRAYTNKALDLVEEGYILPADMILMCLTYMPDSEVQDMLHCNEVCDCFYEDEEN
tara:strand:- start:2 stop:202 length:201 start_codon:yes stop_codon:yes gene_type:complete